MSYRLPTLRKENFPKRKGELLIEISTLMNIVEKLPDRLYRSVTDFESAARKASNEISKRKLEHDDDINHVCE